MKHLLAPAQRELLAQLSWSNVLLGFDYDGTLAPLVSDPERAELRPATRKLLAARGTDPQTSTPDEFARFIKSETERWGKVVRASGATAD